MIFARRASLLKFCFSAAKDPHGQGVSAAHAQSSRDHNGEPQPSSGQSGHHLVEKEEYIIEGKGPVSNLVKKYLRLVGWEPDVPRSRTESTHFNEFLNIPILKEKPHSLYKYMQYMPTWVLRIFVENVHESLKSRQAKELNSDCYLPEQVENGVFVYHSVTEFQSLKRFRSLEAAIIPITLFLSNYPWATIFTVALGFVFAYPRIYMPSKVMVGRLDVLPDKNQLRIEKVTWFGRTRVVYMDPNNVEYVDSEDKSLSGVSFWVQNWIWADRKLVFRNKQTNELLIFDKSGFWSEEGLKHPLIH